MSFTAANQVGFADSGVAGYVFTRDLVRAFRVTDRLKYGQIGLDQGLMTTEVASFGGVKESGSGREGSKYGVEDCLNVKYMCLGGLRDSLHN